MPSAVSICSNALQMLGDSPINSFTDANSPNGLDRARLCANLWPTVRDAILRSHPWNCATKRIVLSPAATAPAFEFTHKFALPGDWLRNVQINGLLSERVDHVVESGYLLMNGSALYLRYIWRNEDPGSWDPLLVNCAELAMSARLAKPITDSITQQQQQEQLLQMALKQARTVDGQDESTSQLGDSAIWSVRQL